MTNSYTTHSEAMQDRYGLQVAAHLTIGSQALPHDITERLRASRYQALAKRKVMPVKTATSWFGRGGTVVLTSGDEGIGFWNSLASALPVIALAIGLVTLNSKQADEAVLEVANVDTALLTDDLPPSAYTDPGFIQFLKAHESTGN